jgi:formylglycine-generating enzyme required for sulfatase activity
VAEIEKSKAGGTALRLPANHLKRRGYRLPSEAEWEYACRAGARAIRYYGSSLELLPRYACYVANSQGRSWPVGQKRPNDLGLFDMHGNVWQWCQESGWGHPPGSRERPARDMEDRRPIVNSLLRVMRGASYGDHPEGVRAGQRNVYRPSDRSLAVGFRVARTCDGAGP